MIAILAEDDSDAEVLKCLVRRRLNQPQLTIKTKGYEGSGGLLRKGARDIKRWSRVGATAVIVCHDADSNPAQVIRDTLVSKVIGPSGFSGSACLGVPVEEMEAWIIADELAVSSVIPSFRFAGHASPETINSPKEWLCNQSRAANGKPLYAPKTFNPSVARYLRFDVVAQKCPSFRRFLECVDTL